MSTMSAMDRLPELPPRWLRLWCFFLGCVVPAGGCTVGLIAAMSLVLVNRELSNWGLWGALLALFAFYAFAMFLIIVTGISVAFYNDIEAADSVTWLCGVCGGVVLVVSCVVGFHEQFRLAEWLSAFSSVYYLATTAILHARLSYLERRYERLRWPL